MTDDEVIDAARFSLLPLKVNTLPSERVLVELPDEPFVVSEGVGFENGITVWYDLSDESFAVSGTKVCKAEDLAYEAFATYDELAAAVAAG